MYAIIEVGGKQYKVESGMSLDVEKINKKAGDNIIISKVMLVADNGKKAPIIGSPFIKEAKVSAKVIGQIKTKKAISFKFRRRKSSHTTKGHRQSLSKILIDKISLDN
ncbi:MAG: 50S ribosomal protein L21 [Candidatus Gygaella obscura]|nr:50S ribosomal protein L21 [Candidatus Gygaella obscura]